MHLSAILSIVTIFTGIAGAAAGPNPVAAPAPQRQCSKPGYQCPPDTQPIFINGDCICQDILKKRQTDEAATGCTTVTTTKLIYTSGLPAHITSAIYVGTTSFKPVSLGPLTATPSNAEESSLASAYLASGDFGTDRTFTLGKTTASGHGIPVFTPVTSLETVGAETGSATYTETSTTKTSSKTSTHTSGASTTVTTNGATETATTETAPAATTTRALPSSAATHSYNSSGAATWAFISLAAMVIAAFKSL